MSLRAPSFHVLIAGLCFVAHNAIVLALAGLGAPLWLAMAGSFVLVCLLGYALHARFTFEQPHSWPALARYAIAMSVNFPLALGGTWLLTVPLALPLALAAPLASSLLVLVNFVLGRWAITGRLASFSRSAANGQG
jgi:putative flippase GtrA